MFDSEERASSVSDIRISSVNDIRIEENEDLKADELRKLSEYFVKSRDEIQKKVNSLLSFDFVAHNPKNILNSASISSPKSESAKIIKNFRPIDLETAISLRELTVGSCVHTFSSDWRKAKFIFRPENNDLSYGLLAEKNGSKGLILSVQAVLLKNLILAGHKDIIGEEVNSEWRNKRKILKPNESERRDAFVKSLTEILWTASDKEYSCVTVNSTLNCFDQNSSSSDLKKKSKYFPDGLTERLHLYEFNSIKKLEEFIRKNLEMFQKEDGCVLFLYSLILSRRVENVKQDLQGSCLIGDMEECKLGLYNLILSGFATPYVHNGTVVYNSEGEALEKPMIGFKNRNEIGILYWDIKEDDKKRTEVGSMLKTPKYPIWLTIMGKNLISVLFNTNIELMNNWRLEQKFNLHFYSGLKKHEQECMIGIISRDSNDIILSEKEILKAKYSKFKFSEDEKESEIYEVIKTKWPGCQITGSDPKEIMTLL